MVKNRALRRKNNNWRKIRYNLLLRVLQMRLNFAANERSDLKDKKSLAENSALQKHLRRQIKEYRFKAAAL